MGGFSFDRKTVNVLFLLEHHYGLGLEFWTEAWHFNVKTFYWLIRFFFTNKTFVKSKILNLGNSSSILKSGRDCSCGWGVHVQRSQYHDWGETLQQGTQPSTAHQAPQHWLLTASGVCSQCVCVSTCVSSLLTVCALGWVKCRAQILSMGHHTWPHATSFPFFLLMDWSGMNYCDAFISCLDADSDGTIIIW